MNYGMTIPKLAGEMGISRYVVYSKFCKLFPDIELGKRSNQHYLTEEQEQTLRNTNYGFAGITITELADELYKEPRQIRKAVHLLIPEALTRTEKGYKLTEEQAEKVRKYIREKEIQRKNAIGTKLKRMIRGSGMTREEIAGRLGIRVESLNTNYLAPGAKIPKRGLSRLLLILQGESKE